MTTLAPPGARTRTRTKPHARSHTRARHGARSSARTQARAATHHSSRARAGVGVFVAVAVVFVLVSAVVFHVVLAQGQLQLDRLGEQIAAERREYEQRRLETSTLASPPRIIEEGLRQGMVRPPEPPPYLHVPGFEVPADDAGTAPSTLDDWEQLKPTLGDTRP
jgi:hypothetical protein